MRGALSTPLRRRWAGVALVLAVALSAPVLAPPAQKAGASADPTDHGTHLGDDVVVVHDGDAPAAGAGASWASAAPMALGGFNLMVGNLGIRSTYTIRIATDHANWGWLQGPVQEAAQQLSAATGASYVIGPTVGGGAPSDGEVVVSFTSGSQCGSLGCATPYWTWVAGGPPKISRAAVWVNPSLVGNHGMLLQIVLHELGHAAGLDHYEPLYDGQRQVMFPIAYDWDLIHHYRSGDLNGLFTVAGNGFRQPCPPFNDVFTNNQFCPDIKWMADNGLAEGFPDGSFKPSIGLTRQAMASFLHRMEGSPEPDLPPELEPTDVPESHPFHEAISWMIGAGIATGFDDGTFRPGAQLTRQAMAAFLYRLAGEPGLPLVVPSFIDVTAINAFLTPIGWLAASGITSGFGDGTFRPGATLTRQAMAAFIHRMADLEL